MGKVLSEPGLEPQEQNLVCSRKPSRHLQNYILQQSYYSTFPSRCPEENGLPLCCLQKFKLSPFSKGREAAQNAEADYFPMSSVSEQTRVLGLLQEDWRLPLVLVQMSS